VTTFGVPFEVDPAVIELMARWAGEQLTERMEIKITEWEPERVVRTMPVPHNRQYFGLHGGASAVLADTLGSIAASMWSMPEKVPMA
jgi:acyl-coenzyme A thioesterase PaaI-like protein